MLARPGWYAAARQGVAKQLLALPAAQQLTVDAVAAFLDAAVELLLEPLVDDVCALPAASDLQPTQLLAVIQHALQRRMDKAINTLTRQPAAQIFPEQLSEVMAEAMKLRLSAYALLPLDCLLASQKPPLSRGSYMCLLQLAEQQQCLEHVPALLMLPHAINITPALLQRLLAGALHEQAGMIVCSLRDVPAAAKLEPAAILQLLEAAVVQSDRGEVMPALACLPRAGDISAEAAQALLAIALQHRLDFNATWLLEWLPSADKIGAAGVSELLHTSFGLAEARGLVQSLCFLKGAKAINAEGLLRLLQHALRLRQMALLLELPGAAGLSAADVELLLLRCIQLQWPPRSDGYEPEDNAKAIVNSLRTAEKLDGAALLRLLQAAVAHGDAVVLPLLVQQPASSGIAAADVAALLEAAVLRNDVHLVQQLCKLAGAQALEPSVLLPLLQAAVACRCDMYNAASNTGVFLLQLPGAQQLSAESVQALMQVASGVNWHGMRFAAAAALEALLAECRQRWQLQSVLYATSHAGVCSVCVCVRPCHGESCSI
jgi:hypothetical protein